nr:ParB/RepB/Spo0J family partition protein [Paludisphaera mucosa]
MDVAVIETGRIQPDTDQPRTEFDPEALERLAESLKTRGQLQPIQVRWDEGRGAYVIILGERRWRAAQLAGLATIRAVIRDGTLGDKEKLALQLVENCLREDLSPMEQARAFRSLMDRQGWTQEKLSEELAVSRTAIVRALSLLKLPAEIQDRVEQGGLAPSAAHEIAKLEDPTEQVRLAEETVRQGLGQKDLAARVKRTPKGKPKAPKVPVRVVLKAQGFRVEVSRKAGVPSEAIEPLLLALLDQLRVGKAGEDQEAA